MAEEKKTAAQLAQEFKKLRQVEKDMAAMLKANDVGAALNIVAKMNADDIRGLNQTIRAELIEIFTKAQESAEKYTKGSTYYGPIADADIRAKSSYVPNPNIITLPHEIARLKKLTPSIAVDIYKGLGLKSSYLFQGVVPDSKNEFYR